jgi:hypothetical protein
MSQIKQQKYTINDRHFYSLRIRPIFFSTISYIIFMLSFFFILHIFHQEYTDIFASEKIEIRLWKILLNTKDRKADLPIDPLPSNTIFLKTNDFYKKPIPAFLISRKTRNPKFWKVNAIGYKDDLIFFKYNFKVYSINANDKSFSFVKNDIIQFNLMSVFPFIIFAELLLYFFCFFRIIQLKNNMKSGEHSYKSFVEIKNSSIFTYILQLIILSFSLFIIYIVLMNYFFSAKHLVYINLVLCFILLSISFLNIISAMLHKKYISILNHPFFRKVLSETFLEDPNTNTDYRKMLLTLDTIHSLQTIDNMEKENKSVLPLVLMKLGFLLDFPGKSNSEFRKAIIAKNNEILEQISILFSLGLIFYDGMNIRVSLFGKEKLELPRIFFLSNIPFKFEIYLARAMGAFRAGDNYECFNICCTDLFEGFLKWFCKNIYRDEKELQEQCKRFINKKPHSLEMATVGQLENLVFYKLSNSFPQLKDFEEECHNILKSCKSIRNRFSHDKENKAIFSESSYSIQTYDFYNLIRVMINKFCIYFL